jgi:TRAP-type C4-dicarboxylate transport system substrate-binding protein/pimeloyl-ACP methyl ester carboxylesterase
MGRVLSALALIYGAIICSNAAASTIHLAAPAHATQSAFVQQIVNSKNLDDVGIRVSLVEHTDEDSIVEDVIKGSAEVGLVSLDAFIDHSFKNQPTLASIFVHPFILDNRQDLLDIQNSALGDAALADIARSRLVPLEFWNMGSENLISNFEIATPGDFQRLRIGTARETISATMLSRLGASQTIIPLTDFSSSLVQGKINATIVRGASSELYRHFGMTAYFSPIRPLVGILFANPKYWHGLSEREKRAWRYTSKLAAKFANQKAYEQIAAARKLGIFRPIDFPFTQKIQLLKTLFPNDPIFLQYAILVQKSLDQIHNRSLKKKTEIERPLIYPKPSRVIFVTDRDDEGGDDLSIRFGSKREATWTPICGIPKFTLDLTRDLGGTYDGIISMVAPTIHGTSNCIALVSSQINSYKRALIFIHGFDTSFGEALRRAAGIAYDYRYKGIIIVWAWPSDGSIGSYFFDEDSSTWTTPHFIDFLRALHYKNPKLHFDLLAHSMGARILLRALYELRGEKIPIDSIIFAAPDEARDIFEQSIVKTGHVATLQTLYGSEYDRALSISRYLHSPQGMPIPRAGDGGSSILIIKNVESIDTSELHADFIGHSYVFDVPEAVVDVQKLVDEHWSAIRRGLPVRHIHSKTYWALIP